MENKVHNLMYKKLGETITDIEMCNEVVKALSNVDYGYMGNLSVADICKWVQSIKNRIRL